MTDDLVKRLRLTGERQQQCTACYKLIDTADEAADRIEKLEGQKEIYFNAFTKSTVRIKELEDALGLMVEYGTITIEDFKRARRILDKKLTYYEAGFGKMVDEWRRRRAADRIETLERILRQLVCDCFADCKHYMEPIPSCMCFGAFPKEGKDG